MEMPKSLNITIILFKIMSYFYSIFSILIIVFGIFSNNGHNFNAFNLITFIVLGIFLFAFAILYSKVSLALKEGKYWAWITGIILSGLMLPSLLIVIGIPCLIGLLDKNSKKYCEQEELPKQVLNV
ncbi:MAG: hypothetical protein H6622_14770 [Halobacteriovoraceae bacterium]|nr:hypothetical protein [Halobacteriovoraceae bacterium]